MTLKPIGGGGFSGQDFISRTRLDVTPANQNLRITPLQLGKIPEQLPYSQIASGNPLLALALGYKEAHRKC
jgi:hypothetical protein